MSEKNWKLDIDKFEEFLLENSIEKPNELQDIQQIVKVEIENILGKNALSELLIKSKEYWIITMSENIINKFEQEKEIKILWVDKEKLILDLVSKAGATLNFEWTIKDTYYDFNDDHIEASKWKTSFRVREKIDNNWNSKFFYTIKRKEKKDVDSAVMRVCYEKEFKINNIILFIELLNYLWFKKIRAKLKNRQAFDLWKIKFDIDDYSEIPTLLEIEAETSEIAEFYINSLWLQDYERNNWWSRSLFEKYWVKYKTFT